MRFLKASKGIELEDGDALFHFGDRADAFYCIMYGTMTVVMDFAHMAAPTLNEFEEIIKRARVHSSFMNPGGKLDMSTDATYVVRTMKPLEVFGDVGLLHEEQQRTASVMATENTLLMQIDRDTFMALRACNLSRELREKMAFLARVACLDHWEDDAILKLCDRMEKLQHTYNDVIVIEGEPANNFYFVKHGDCRLIKRYTELERDRNQPCIVEISSVCSQHYFGFYEVLLGVTNAVFSVLVSSPSAILYRVDRVDFRQIVLKDVTTEQALRLEVTSLSARADTASVVRDLQKEAKWNQYKQELWARQRAGSNDNSSPDGRGDTDNRRDQALVSNVQWGKTSQIMGGLRNGEDKVSVAIVDLFTNKSVDS
ncbi:hypothetical protein BBO99_00003177 [Phytophthora kernoviae]|uniref:Cyclic nucleotide-binding domain-containing protein n=1 Tax=Phytophthora kernoviae TaxID=325452 RepID=A0A3R7KLH8_9STRA|nr:hypothetical protein BBI17_003274 [Phytophthora kernoviae]RLN82062.1 hypothetical protein BBO99_00003177 [Phytophthora kernoviae]